MIVLTAAMESEIKIIKDAVTDSSRVRLRNRNITTGRLCGKEVAVACTGVGKVQTAMNTQFLIDQFFPSALIMSGIGGSVNPDIKKGDMVLGTEFIQHDFDVTHFGLKRGDIPFSDSAFPKADPELVRIASGWKDAPLKTARVLTGDQFITGSGSPGFEYLTEELKGDIVDMEGAAACTAAAVNNLPFLLIRIVSDSADGKIKGSFVNFVRKASVRYLNLIEYILDKI